MYEKENCSEKPYFSNLMGQKDVAEGNSLWNMGVDAPAIEKNIFAC